MGKFIATKFEHHQQRIVKNRTGKSIVRCLSEKQQLSKGKRIQKEKHKRVNESLLKTSEKNGFKEETTIVEDANSSFQDLRVEIATNAPSGKKYLKLIKPDCDLFAVDELHSRYDQHTKYNLIFIIFDEIALEGLDGITIEALWKRVQHTLKMDNLPNLLKDVIWQAVCSNEKIKFFQLPEAREELPVISEVAWEADIDIYKVEQAPKGSGEWGSCSTLSTRVDVSEEVRKMSLTQAEATYQNKLILLSDEDLRKCSLVDDLMDPNYEFTQIEYCLLEKIGRSRSSGEITWGSKSLPQKFGMDSRSVHHYCKRLNKEHLISKQYCFAAAHLEACKVGRLLHLRRFYHKKKSKYTILMENVVDYLKKCPGYRAPYSTVRSLYGNGKFLKHPEFLKYVDTNINIPFKEFYKEATYREYMTKSLNKERVIQLVQLKDPYMNIAACSLENQNVDSSDDEDEDRDCDIKSYRRIFNKDLVRDVYQFILSKGLEGVNTPELHETFDVDFFTMRSVLKKLATSQLVQLKKCGIGKQTVNHYVAVYLLKNPDGLTNRPIHEKTVQMGTSTALEKLMARQKRKIESLSKERVYTAEQFEADREAQLLQLDSYSLPAVAIQIPQIICNYLIAKPRHLQTTEEYKNFLTRIKLDLDSFKLKLAISALPDNATASLRQLRPSANLQTLVFKEPINDFNIKNFKPDNVSKVFLMHALLNKMKLNKQEIIEFLDPNEISKQPVKRSLQAIDNGKPTDNSIVEIKGRMETYMGSNPVLLVKEKSSEIDMEVYVSTPSGSYKTGDISQYAYDPSIDITQRVVSRINCVLRTIQQQQVFEEMNALLKVIHQEESQAGYDKKIDRKSIHRIFKRLANEGYIKIFHVNLSAAEMKKVLTFVCHPEVMFSHHVIQGSVRQIKEKLHCYTNKAEEAPSEPVEKKKPPVAERSPFIKDDVLKSMKEIKSLLACLKAKSSKKSAKFYGHRPKFARLALIHELLFYMVNELDKNTQPLSKTEVEQLFRNHQIKLTTIDLENLPPVYCNEISWKTFIAPLPYHQGWDDGWALLVDVILRFPITLVTRCYSVNFISTELQEILLHPIKRFYPLRNMSPHIRMIVLYKRKFIHDIYNQLVLLAYCGLLQFGPSSSHDKEKSFFYLNRKATLWDTTSSAPGYHKIEEKEYPKISVYFNGIDDVLKYWSTMNNICVNTNLSARRMVAGKTITIVDCSAKPSLNKARAIKTADVVKQLDVGHLPGDHKGAGGLDSSLWSHIQRNWYFFVKNESPVTETLEDTLKLDKVVNKKVAFDQLKLSGSITPKYYIAKPQDPRFTLPTRKIKPSKTGKSKPILKRIVPLPKRKSSEKKLGLDAVDKQTMRRLGSLRYRPSYTADEERLLILLKIASCFITPGTRKQIISYSTLRDVLHIMEPKSRDKTTRNIANRLKILQKTVPFFMNIESVIPNLYKLVPIAKYFVPFRKFVLYDSDRKGLHRKYKLSDPELNNAFVFLMYYIFKHRKEVEISLHGKNTNTDYFNEDNLEFIMNSVKPFTKKSKNYKEPENDVDIRRYTLRNTIQSALSFVGDRKAWTLQTYKIYQQFSEEILRNELQEMKNLRMIQFKKDPLKTFFTPYRLSAQYIFSQSSTFIYDTMEEAYRSFLDLKYNSDEMDYSFEGMEEKKYGQMFGLNEVLSFMLNETTIQMKFPEHHLILNPNIEDHSEVIDELAKRYQAKLRNDQKDVELQAELQSGLKIDDEDVEMAEPEPGSSKAPTEQESEIELIPFDDDEPLDLSITAKNSTTIDSLKHWISDCIDTERVRSPSPELLNLEVNQPQVKENETMKTESDPARKEDDRILTLDEIKEEMQKPSDNTQKRLVPYISDLTKLLTANFEEIENEECADYLMKKHFVQQYPSLEKLTVNGLETHYLSKFLENRTSNKDFWVKIEREAHVDRPSDKHLAFEEILKTEGAVEDIHLAEEMLLYIHEKNVHGATGYELKEKFCNCGKICSLELILQILVAHHILLRTGVCSIRFIHHDYQNVWLTDTFVLTPEQVSSLPNQTTPNGDLQELEARIRDVTISKWIKIKPLPWATIDGTLDKNMLKMWLSQVFTYCIENPKCPLTVLCDKFCFLKPVDLFYLVEILEEIGALEMRTFKTEKVDLFSEYQVLDDSKATFLDRFEDIYVEPNNTCFIALGSFLHNL